MKKTTHQILYAILFSAVGVLILMQFSSTSKKNEKADNKEMIQPSLENDTNTGGVLKIAYVNSDTVSKHYEYAKKRRI